MIVESADNSLCRKALVRQHSVGPEGTVRWMDYTGRCRSPRENKFCMAMYSAVFSLSNNIARPSSAAFKRFLYEVVMFTSIFIGD